jgi:hypothetical protein
MARHEERTATFNHRRMKMPYYVATIQQDSKSAGRTRLIEAANAPQALAHAAKAHITIEKASSSDLIDLTKIGVEVEKAGAI